MAAGNARASEGLHRSAANLASRLPVWVMCGHGVGAMGPSLGRELLNRIPAYAAAVAKDAATDGKDAAAEKCMEATLKIVDAILQRPVTPPAHLVDLAIVARFRSLDRGYDDDTEDHEAAQALCEPPEPLRRGESLFCSTMVANSQWRLGTTLKLGSLAATNGARAVCLPGGGVATWDAAS
jgi:hypothetical protein